jgi:hypothetical protein
VGIEYCPHSCGHCDDDDWHEPSPTKKPTSYCHSSVEVALNCYEDHEPEKLRVHFENCHPESKDWIGIYEVRDGNLGNTLEWWGNSFTWKFTCGSKKCNYSDEYGTLRFKEWWEDLRDVEYKAYLFDTNGYDVKASSDVFKIGDCNNHPSPTRSPSSPSRSPSSPNSSPSSPTKSPSSPTRSPSSPTKLPSSPTRSPSSPTKSPSSPTRSPSSPTKSPSPPTRSPSSPTKKPTSYCHSSMEVDSYCYKDHHPTTLKFFLNNCNPDAKDWIGIYKVRHGYLGNTLEWWGNSFMWQFTCGSKTCNYHETEGTLYFEDWWSSLTDGEYKVHLFHNNGFDVKASSDTFKVGNCY